MSWIKLFDLWADAQAMNVAVRLGITDMDKAVGLIARFFLYADRTALICEDNSGFIPKATPASIDLMMGAPGFTEALASDETRWVLIEEHGVRLINYGKENSSNSKRRGSESKRKDRSRSDVYSTTKYDENGKPMLVDQPSADTVRTNVRMGADNSGTQSGRNAGLDRDREEEKTTTTREAKSNLPEPKADTTVSQVSKIISPLLTGDDPDSYRLAIWLCREYASQAFEGEMDIGAVSFARKAVEDAQVTHTSFAGLTPAKTWFGKLLARCKRDRCMPGKFPDRPKRAPPRPVGDNPFAANESELEATG